jgi:hypothetical protein
LCFAVILAVWATPVHAQVAERATTAEPATTTA